MHIYLDLQLCHFSEKASKKVSKGKSVRGRKPKSSTRVKDNEDSSGSDSNNDIDWERENKISGGFILGEDEGKVAKLNKRKQKKLNQDSSAHVLLSKNKRGGRTAHSRSKSNYGRRKAAEKAVVLSESDSDSD